MGVREPNAVTRESIREWERLKAGPDADVDTFARLVLNYVGPVDESMLDGDAELRRRARAILSARNSQQ